MLHICSPAKNNRLNFDNVSHLCTVSFVVVGRAVAIF
jgi:hypothetical protein